MLASRRRFLQNSASLAALFALPLQTRGAMRRDASVVSEQHYEVTDVRRTTVKLDFREVPARNMAREVPHWQYIELCDVTLKCGVQGTGETMIFYTWGATADEDVARVIGKSAVELMWDDSLGAGLQMALFDAVGKAADMPAHQLMGQKVHATTPLSWWNIDTSAEDMVADCKEALRLGYMSYKTKGRPWFDVIDQVTKACAAVPENFKIDMDFNDTLLDAERGLPILKQLEKFPQVDIFETPIPQSDIKGNRAICDASRVNVAMHYGNPTPRVVAETGCCDGFVMGGGASKVMAGGRFCDETGMPFWLQLVGAGMTAAFSLHFGGVLDQARWPAVNCHQLFQHDLLVEPIRLKDGHATVPDRPGIGYEVNRDLVEAKKTEKPSERPEPERLIETVWADGLKMYTANNGNVNFMLTAANAGKYPYFAKGAFTRLVPDDGTPKWRKLYDRARAEGPFRD